MMIGFGVVCFLGGAFFTLIVCLIVTGVKIERSEDNGNFRDR